MKLKNLVPILLVISLFTGCSYKTNYKSDFNNNSSLNKNYKINGNIENNIQRGFFRSTIHNRVVLYINNKLVIKTPLNDDYSGRTELYYESKPLIIECRKDNAFTQPKCIILLDGENLGTLNFEYDLKR